MYSFALHEFHQRKKQIQSTREALKIASDYISSEANSHRHNSQVEANLNQLRDLIEDLRAANAFTVNDAIVNVCIGCGAIAAEAVDNNE